MHDAVAIIGVGARFPGATDATAFRRMIANGKVQKQPVPEQRWDHSVAYSPNRRHANKTRAQMGAFMDDIDQFAPDFFGITPKRAKVMDPQQRLILELSRQALEDAGYAGRSLAEGGVGVYVGVSTSDHRSLITGAVNIPFDLAGRSGEAPPLTPEEITAATAALPPIHAYTIVGQQLNMIAANVSQAFDFKGPAFAIDTACSSALAALHEAVMHLRTGVVDAALVGGVYVQLEPCMMVCFSRVGALSPSDRCLPFQTEADGFVLGEGAGVVVIKRLADAQRDGDRVIAVIRGIAMNNDGSGSGPLTPRAEGQSEVIAKAWQAAGVELSSVGLLEAHSTATRVGDRIELEALTKVFAPHVHGVVPITSVKANIGHGLSSAGMASLIKSVFAVQDGVIPPQPLGGTLCPEFSESAKWLRVPDQTESWESPAGIPRRAGVNAFGFGGTNVHVVLEEAPLPAPRRQLTSVRLRRCELSAPTVELLAAYCGEIRTTLAESDVRIEDVAYTLAQRRRDAVQVVLVADTLESLLEQLVTLHLELEQGIIPASPTTGETGEGRLITLPPSPLATRRFWLLDETKVKHAPAALPALTPVIDSVVDRGPGLVVAAIVEVTALRADEIQPETRFVGDLSFDSLTTLEFMTVLGRSLPGMTLPRTLFTADLTVKALEDFIAQSSLRPEREAAAVTCKFDRAGHAWLAEHRPGGQAVLPLAALVMVALEDRPARARLTDFQVLVPWEVREDEVVLERVDSVGGGFIIRVTGSETVLVSGVVDDAVEALPPLPSAPVERGGLSVMQFYAEYGFHGPALQMLTEIPEVGATNVLGRLVGQTDRVMLLDGVLQLALYWLAATRQQLAVVTGFAEFRELAPWSQAGVLTVEGRLTGATADRLLGDFDLRNEAGELVLQWRGIEAQVIDAAPAIATCVAEAWPEVKALAAQKEALSAAGITMPYFQVHEGVASATTRIAGREYLNFSSYNYLELAGEAAVNLAATEAVQCYGTSASASRVASGERPLHGELEREISDFLGCQSALTLVGGHATNVSLIGHMFGPEDLVIHDSLAHDSIVSGARLSGARRLVFPHNDVAALAQLLQTERPKARRTLIAVEGVYSMDGDLAPLEAIVDLKHRHQAMLLVDEAHSLGVLGATGRGIGEHCGVKRSAVDLWMGTLSKTLASCGGYIAGESVLIDYLRYTLPGFVYSVGLSPVNAAAALAALRLLATRPELPRCLQARSDFFRRMCRERGIDTGLSQHSAVIPCITGSSELALHASQELGKRGINVQPIFHPTVEEGKARLRFFITTGHTETQLRETAEALAEIMTAGRKAKA